MPDSIRNVFGVKGSMPLDVTRALESWKNDLSKIKENIEDLEERDDITDQDPELVRLKRAKLIAELEVEAWDIARAQQDSSEVESYLNRRLQDVVDKLTDATSSATTSDKSSTTSGSH
ncbi:hypothetical protein MFIFM68171_05822 [Madurella fahalii]|uniref:Uncharacterized protein n=1 Tax=Madurella fahalii TaxID=1157608 RepID=A0ABQ0GCZ6_9PEZI